MTILSAVRNRVKPGNSRNQGFRETDIRVDSREPIDRRTERMRRDTRRAGGRDRAPIIRRFSYSSKPTQRTSRYGEEIRSRSRLQGTPGIGRSWNAASSARRGGR